jgi:hypothetical protein
MRKKKYFEAFVDVGQIGEKTMVYIVKLHVTFKIRLTRKNSSFYAYFLPPGFLTKKHVNLSHFPDTPRLFFVCRIQGETRELMKETNPI